jgi:hypothetical protein
MNQNIKRILIFLTTFLTLPVAFSQYFKKKYWVYLLDIFMAVKELIISDSVWKKEQHTSPYFEDFVLYLMQPPLHKVAKIIG